VKLAAREKVEAEFADRYAEVAKRVDEAHAQYLADQMTRSEFMAVYVAGEEERKRLNRAFTRRLRLVVATR
jgi:hypothetical protein